MFNKHLFKVIVGFCGMIILGLLSLVFTQFLDERNSQKNLNTQINTAVSLPPIQK